MAIFMAWKSSGVSRTGRSSAGQQQGLARSATRLCRRASARATRWLEPDPVRAGRLSPLSLLRCATVSHRFRPYSTLACDRVRDRTRVRREVDMPRDRRSEEHTSELQSLMRLSYAVFCLKKKHKNH